MHTRHAHEMAAPTAADSRGFAQPAAVEETLKSHYRIQRDPLLEIDFGIILPPQMPPFEPPVDNQNQSTNRSKIGQLKTA